jgi:hypothetical protein
MPFRMKCVVSIAAVVATISSLDFANAGECLRRPAWDRGVAILSPLESPDPCPAPPVGGDYCPTPYYRGYCPDRRCFVNYGMTATNGYDGPGLFANTPAPYARSDYGAFTGASRDESNLLRLGGAGPSSRVTGRPYQRETFDMIDRLQGIR